MWFFLQQSIDFGASSNYLQWETTTCVPKNVFRLRETVFDKFDSFGTPYADNRTFLTTWQFFDFESVCVEDENFKDTETTT